VRDAVANIVSKSKRGEEEARAGFLNPQGRMIQPEEVAAAVAYIASEDACSVTGQALSIAGGEL
jgi:3-hydroxybutyrate dehydrogenase